MPEKSKVEALYRITFALIFTSFVFLPLVISSDSLSPAEGGAAPRLNSISPSVIYAGGTTPITILGENFSPQAIVSIYGEGLVLAGSFRTKDFAREVMVADGYAYVADDNAGLEVIRIRNPRQLARVGSCDTEGTAHGVWVSGEYAYLADGDQGLAVINISDPENPKPCAHLALGGYAWKIKGRDGLVYLANDQGLAIVDVHDPLNPGLKAVCETPGSACGLSLSGDYAYVADWSKGVSIIKISDPNSPRLVCSFDTSGLAKGVCTVGEYAYVANGAAGLKVIHINDPENPLLVASLDVAGDAEGIWAAGGRVYLAAADAGLQMIDVRDAAKPGLIGSYDTTGLACGLWVEDDYVYMADGPSGLQVINTHRFPSLGGCDTAGDVQGLWIGEDYAYLAGGERGLEIVALRENQPTLATTYHLQGMARKVEVSGNYAYVVDSRTGVYVINIQNPTHPLPAGSYYSRGIPYGLSLNYPLLYVADGTDGVAILDITKPSPQVLGRVRIPGVVMDVLAREKAVYAACAEQGLVIIAADSPSAPIIKGYCDTPGKAQGVWLEGEIAYVADGTEGLALINVQDQTHPTLLAQVDTPGEASDVVVSGGYAFIADGQGDLAVADIRNPHKPLLIAHVEVPGIVREVFLKNGKIYLAAGEAGLQILAQSFCWTLEVAEVSSDGTRIQAFLPPGLRRGDYTLRVTNPDGLADWQTDMIGISGLVYIPEGLNILFCPDGQEGILTSDELLAYLEEDYAKSVQGYDPVSQKFQTTAWVNGEIRGKEFILSDAGACLLYMKRGKMVDFSIDQIEVYSLSQIINRLSPGMSLLGIPTGLSSTALTSYQLLTELLKTGNVSSLQRYSQQGGNWLVAYRFMGQNCGDAYPLPPGEGCLLYVPATPSN
ncbi:MAG: hypothetical protein K6U11_02075 [bacterium]|nr:hypothetical protein [bacterium]